MGSCSSHTVHVRSKLGRDRDTVAYRPLHGAVTIHSDFFYLGILVVRILYLRCVDELLPVLRRLEAFVPLEVVYQAFDFLGDLRLLLGTLGSRSQYVRTNLVDLFVLVQCTDHLVHPVRAEVVPAPAGGAQQKHRLNVCQPDDGINLALLVRRKELQGSREKLLILSA